jgi:hypothetical protein
MLYPLSYGRKSLIISHLLPIHFHGCNCLYSCYYTFTPGQLLATIGKVADPS